MVQPRETASAYPIYFPAIFSLSMREREYKVSNYQSGLWARENDQL
jgi:hypothetical protein